jgi:hypothetical protein
MVGNFWQRVYKVAGERSGWQAEGIDYLQFTIFDFEDYELSAASFEF